MWRMFKPKWAKMLDKLVDVEIYLAREGNDNYQLLQDLMNVTDRFASTHEPPKNLKN